MRDFLEQDRAASAAGQEACATFRCWGSDCCFLEERFTVAPPTPRPASSWVYLLFSQRLNREVTSTGP